MTGIKDGFPPGYNFRRDPNQSSQRIHQQKAQAQNNAINELANKIPGGIQGTPVEFIDGIPQIDENEPIVPVDQLSADEQVAHKATEQAFKKPQQQQPQQPSLPARSQPVKTHPNYQHPVLQKMLKKFGIGSEKKYNVDLISSDGDKIIYTMVLVPDELSTWAVTNAQEKIIQDGQNAAVTWFELLHVCLAVVGIDGEPIWRIFDVTPTSDEQSKLVEDPFNMSFRMKKLTAQLLAEQLWRNTIPFAGKLSEFYTGKVLGDNKIVSSYEKEFEGAYRYVCPHDGCREYLILAPRFDQDQEKPFFCKMHGSEMIKVASLLTEANRPLA